MKQMKLRPSSFPGLVGAACRRGRVCCVKETEEGIKNKGQRTRDKEQGTKNRALRADQKTVI